MKKILDWFLSRYIITFTEKDRDAARALLAAARRQAITGWKPLCAGHPALRTLAENHKEAYEYYYTVAFAVIGMLGANMYFPQAKRRPTTEAIKAGLESWRRDAYGNDAHHLFSQLNITSASAEAVVGGWIVEQIARKAGDEAETERIRALKNDEELVCALGNDLIAQAGETVVACFLEDKKK